MTTDDSDIKYDDTLVCLFFSNTELTAYEWETMCQSLNGMITSAAKDYIWHRDEFKVYLPIVSNGEIPHHLLSRTCFGDNIEDEWFIVHLVLKMTEIYNNLIVQIQDSDGDFLLIEAADYLPAWVNPETTENRVFIFNKHIHIIQNTLASTDSYLKIGVALKIVTQNPELTKASPEIELAIRKRIGEHPKRIKEDVHKAIVKLPIEIATVLKLKPSLIAPIVNAYCNMDTFDAKHCVDGIEEGCIKTEVIFTKYLYAMLMQSELPKCVKYNISSIEKKTQLGLKITCAYRIIMSRLSKNIYDTSEYNRFLNNLIKNGYFKNNLEHSLEYSQLLEKARAYFLDMECSVSLNAGNIIKDIMTSVEFNKTAELLKQRNNTQLLEDDDDWLNVNPEQLNEFLNTQYGKSVKLKNKDPITPHILTSELTSFLKETSNFDGIEQPAKQTSKDLIEFQSDEFVNCLEKMLNIVSKQNYSDYNNSEEDIDIDDDIDGTDDDKDDSDYGVDSDTVSSCRAQDTELSSKLISIKSNNAEVNIFENLSHCLKEEGPVGPAGTILRQIGLKKCDVINSDGNN